MSTKGNANRRVSLARMIGRTPFFAIVMLVGCESGIFGDIDLPKDRGVTWICSMEVNREEGPPSLVNFGVCGNPDVAQSRVEEKCVDECEDMHREWGLVCGNSAKHICVKFGESPRCRVLSSNSTNQGCPEDNDDAYHLTGGPSQFGAALTASTHLSVSDPDGSADTAVSGRVEYTIDPDPRYKQCPPEGCRLILSRLDLAAADFELSMDSILIPNPDISRVRLINIGEIVGTWRSDGTFVVNPRAARMEINFAVNGEDGSTSLTNSQALTGLLDPAQNVFQITNLRLSEDNATVTVNMSGTLDAHPPEAVIAPAGQQFECTSPLGAKPTFDGSASSDPDGEAIDFLWQAEQQPAGTPSLGTGALFEPQLAIGDHIIDVVVRDPDLSFGLDSTTAFVRDTTAPNLVVPPDTFIEACDDLQAVDVGQAMVTDVCDPAPDLAVEIVQVNGVNTLSPYTPDVALPQGETVIRYTATDVYGNTISDVQHVVIDRGASCCPPNLQVVVGSQNDDNLSGGNQQQCLAGLAGNDTLTSGNQSDVIFGGTGNDTFLAGGNSGDSVYGGTGDDLLQGSNAKEELFGGPGNDRLLAGSGKDRLYGGAGQDELRGDNGNDTLVIRALCEVLPGELIDGGAGTDRLETPVPLSQLQAAGATVINVEQVVVTGPIAGAECF